MNMAPREGECVTNAQQQNDCNVNFKSAFWNRLNTLPMVQSTISTGLGIYSTSKENAFLGKGIGVLEYGVNLASSPVKKVACTIAEKIPVASTTAHKLDNLALNCLDTLEHKIPAIQNSPTEIVTNVKNGASTVIHSGVRRVMKTYPGQQVVKGLDSMINWSEMTIEGVAVDESPSDSLEPGKEPEAPKGGVITVKLRNGVVVPLKLYLQMLKMVKHMLANMAGVTTRRKSPRKSSPRKLVTTRKQRTPRKRIAKQSLVSSLTTRAMGMLGLRNSDVANDVMKVEGSGSPGSEEPLGTSIKRKFDESSDEESEAESLNLASALQHYDSDVDSDYCPEEDSQEESLEYNSGDTESDLEIEGAGTSKKGQPLHQLKNPVEPPPETKPSASSQVPQQPDVNPQA